MAVREEPPPLRESQGATAPARRRARGAQARTAGRSAAARERTTPPARPREGVRQWGGGPTTTGANDKALIVFDRTQRTMSNSNTRERSGQPNPGAQILGFFSQVISYLCPGPPGHPSSL